MEERQVTAAGDTHPLEQPFFVLATQNPIELEGTYALPEAQLDRFLLNSVIDFLPVEEEMKMVAATTSPAKETLEAVLNAEEIEKLQDAVREIPVSDHVVSYAVRLAVASRPREDNPLEWIRKEVKWGAGSRASKPLILAGKARALLDGRVTVAIEDIGHGQACPPPQDPAFLLRRVREYFQRLHYRQATGRDPRKRLRPLYNIC